MTDYSISPPPELVQQWIQQYGNSEDPRWQAYEQDIATQAARWGADQELEACCEWVNREIGTGWGSGTKLRAARRPKPPSLAEQALDTLRSMQIEPVILNGINVNKDVMDQYSIIRRALERLQELEDANG